jgi:hypothetical protein
MTTYQALEADSTDGADCADSVRVLLFTKQLSPLGH